MKRKTGKSSALAKLIHDVAVVHNFMEDINRMPVTVKGVFDNFYGPNGPRAKTPGLRQDHPHWQLPIPILSASALTPPSFSSQEPFLILFPFIIYFNHAVRSREGKSAKRAGVASPGPFEI